MPDKKPQHRTQNPSNPEVMVDTNSKEQGANEPKGNSPNPDSGGLASGHESYCEANEACQSHCAHKTGDRHGDGSEKSLELSGRRRRIVGKESRQEW